MYREAPRRSGGPRRWFTDRRVGTKIGLAVGACLVLCLAQGAVGLVEMNRMGNDAAALYSRDARGLADLGDARSTINRMRQRVLLHVLAAPSDKPRRLQQLRELDQTFDTAATALRGDGVLPPDELDGWLAAVTTYRQYRDDVILPASNRQVTGAELAKVLADCDRLFAPVEEGGLRLSGIAVQNAAGQAAMDSHDRTLGITVMIGLLLAGLLLGVGLAVAATKAVVTPLTRVRKVLEAMAEGDLTQHADVDSADELGGMAAALDLATRNVRETVQSVSDSARNLAGASEELSANSAQIAAAARDTSSEVEVASNAMLDISDSVRSVAAGAEQMSASIREIAQNADEAARIAAQAVAAAESASSRIDRLGDSSTEIGNVVKVITAIAEQTNLLALNATIEAARAGEAGKGFAVVAEEVKQLAQETARATGDIVLRVDAIQADTSGAVAAISEIGEVIRRINDYQTTIAGAVEEQTATTTQMSASVAAAAERTEHVTRNITSVAAAVTTTTASVGQAQSATKELAEMSFHLQGLVDRFQHELPGGAR